ncbi:MAG: glycosyltransferase [Actinomycetota bacterium]|nr:glycosyltransferase [Actinomycetota bacterium]
MNATGSSRPRVSCVIAAYNYARYLGEAIDSVLAQSYPAEAVEIVVVDDGSTDHTPEVIAGYGERVVGIRQANAGVSAATQTGLDAATGELLTFLGADDVWPANRLDALLAGLESAPEAGLVWGDMEVVDHAGAPLVPSFRAHFGVPPLGGHVFGRLLDHNFISGGALMFRGELRDRICPIPPGAVYEDWWIAIQAARVGPVVAVPEVVNRYRFHGSNENLGSDGAKRLGLLEGELGFRRWSLQTAGEAATPRELLAALDTLDARVDEVAAAARRAPRQVLGLGDEDREQAVAALYRASAALDARRTEAAVAELVAAAGHDPLYAEPRELLSLLAPHALADTYRPAGPAPAIPSVA